MIVATRILNLSALAFTIAISAFLLLLFDWRALQKQCLRDDSCDIGHVAIYDHPWRHDTPIANMFKAVFLAIFSLYWLYAAMCAALEIRCELVIYDQHAASDAPVFCIVRSEVGQMCSTAHPSVSRVVLAQLAPCIHLESTE